MKQVYIVIICFVFLPTYQLLAQDFVIETQVIPLSDNTSECSGAFVAHSLDHTTTTPNGEIVRQFEANGSGVATNDLDNDGDLDIVLANHAGMNTILWNEGNLNFRTEQLSHGDSRAVMIVDIDGDGWQDILFTRTTSSVSYWHNMGRGKFVLEILPNISEPLYSIALADLDNDGDLDLVGATYDAALLDAFGQEFLLNKRGGVYYYENVDGIFQPTRLADEAQALALILVDINHDNRIDIVVGNDFAVPDYFWVQSDSGWVAENNFKAFSHSTMSYDFADVNNDGSPEIFSTDMKPMSDDEDTVTAWQPILESMQDDRDPNYPQIMENVLLKQNEFTAFENYASDVGIDASGWSWSGKFGDLDQDGWVDLYIVNGFIEYTMFAHLDNHELVEQNHVFRNIAGQAFEEMPEWGLSSIASGRGMSMADLDEDGDLDIVVNNLRNPAQLFENQLCTGKSLQLDLRWEDTKNRNVIGAEVILHTSVGEFYRTIKSSSGYLSGDASRLHFGVPSDTIIQRIEIVWTDGVRSLVDIPENSRLMRVQRKGFVE